MKIGRNAPCSCGSGLKFKRCCLKNNNSSSGRIDGGKSWAKFENNLQRELKDSEVFIQEMPQKEKMSQRLFDLANVAVNQHDLELNKKLFDTLALA